MCENLARKVNPHLSVVDGQVGHREDVDLSNILTYFARRPKSTNQAVSVLKVSIAISSQPSTFVLHQSDLRDLSWSEISSSLSYSHCSAHLQPGSLKDLLHLTFVNIVGQVGNVSSEGWPSWDPAWKFLHNWFNLVGEFHNVYIY